MPAILESVTTPYTKILLYGVRFLFRLYSMCRLAAKSVLNHVEQTFQVGHQLNKSLCTAHCHQNFDLSSHYRKYHPILSDPNISEQMH